MSQWSSNVNPQSITNN